MRVERSSVRPFRFSWLSRFWSKKKPAGEPRLRREMSNLRLETLEARWVPASIPVLNSFPSAPATIFLDFDGSTVAQWGSYSNIQTPAFTVDGDTSTNFSDAEVNYMKAIWEVVSEDFAPFRMNVSTVDPGTYPVNVALHIAIGGNANWIQGGSALAGIALLNSFSTPSLERTVFCFSDNLLNLLSDPLFSKEVGGTISHEGGHAFGLNHQSLYNGTGQLTDVYHPGIDGWGPIMGAPYGMAIETWWNGPTPSGVNSLQDDMAILSNSTNAFGYRTDDYGNDAQNSTALTQADLSNPFQLSTSGVIEQTTDVDAFSFTTGPGQVKIQVTPYSSTLGAPNLVSVVELRDSTGALVAASTGANPNRINSPVLQQTLSAGSYRVYVRSEGSYGRVGQYKVQVDTPITGPVINSSTPSGIQTKPVASVDFKFDQAMLASSFDILSDVVSFIGPGGIDLKSQISGFIWVDSQTLRINFSTQATNGDYSLVIGPNIQSLNNLNMDQNLDGTQGTAQDQYTASFRIAIFGGAPDRYEPNNSLNAAFNFGLVRNLVEKNLSIHATFNDDYYAFTAVSTGIYTVAISFNNDNGDLDLFTFSNQGVVNGYSTTTLNVEQVSFNAIAGFTYYIRTTGYLGSANPNYDLKIAGPTAASDRFEFNDTFGSATNFGNVRKRNEKNLSIGAASDVDFYNFTASITGGYDIATSFFNEFGNLDMVVIDSGLNVIGTSNGITDGEKLHLNLIAGQQYTIRVYGVNSAINNYDLSITTFGRTDIVGRDPGTGVLWAGLGNDLGQFSTTSWGAWSTNVVWVDVVSGDFNGDGWVDVAGRIAQNGEWYVALSNGSSSFTTSKWGTWPAGSGFKDVTAGDFNGDGRTDIVGRNATTQQLYVLTSQPSDTFSSAVWATWSQASDWLDVRVGDFDGDGRADVAGRSFDNGDWYVGLSNGINNFSSGKWTKWTSSIAWTDVLIGDFNGDGRADLTGRWAETGQWWTSLSIGPSGFATSLWATWAPHTGGFQWLDVRAGDFDADGKTDITGRDKFGGNWWTGLSGSGADKNHFVTSYWGTWTYSINWVDVLVGDFNGDGRADIMGRDQASGNWWSAQSTFANSFANKYFSTWTSSITWADVKAADYGN